MSTQAVQHFKALLLQAIDHLKQLLQVMQDERQLLTSGPKEPEILEALVQKKAKLLEKVEADVDQRKAFLADQGLSEDPSGLDAFFTDLPPASAQALRRGWQQLIGLLEKVHQQNNANGLLVNRALQHYDLLSGAMQAGQPGKVKVYRPSGGASGLSIPRNLGKA